MFLDRWNLILSLLPAFLLCTLSAFLSQKSVIQSSIVGEQLSYFWSSKIFLFMTPYFPLSYVTKKFLTTEKYAEINYTKK